VIYSLFPSGEHTTSDKIIWGAKVLWTGALCLVFVVCTLASFWWQVPSSWWSDFWQWYLQITLVISVIVSLWFGIGAVSDIRAFLFRLQHRAVGHGETCLPPASGEHVS